MRAHPYRHQLDLASEREDSAGRPRVTRRLGGGRGAAFPSRAMEVSEAVLSWLRNALRQNATPPLWLREQTPLPTFRERLQLPFQV